MGLDDIQYALPAELDTYMQESIFHMLGFCSLEEQLKQKLSKAEESHRTHALQMQHVQLRLRELEHKRCKSKEEAVLNAQALKRQVAEGQKLTEQYRTLKDEFNKLQQECSLYHNDRDVFMEAAYEAEDRAAEAEDRAAEAEKKIEAVVEELERVKQVLAEDSRIRLEMDYTEYVAPLKSRITCLEKQNTSLQQEVSMLRFGMQQQMSESPAAAMYLREESILQDLLSAAEEQHEEANTKLKTLQETYEKEVTSRQDEWLVHRMVSSAITAGVCKSLEEDKEASLRAVNLEFASICRCMETELCGTRERTDPEIRLVESLERGEAQSPRVKFAEMNVQALLLEVQALREEACLCRGNLDKAEVEVQMLADENKELRILLRRRYAASDSPMQNKGNKGGGRSQSGGRPRSKPYEGHGDDSICDLCNARQPLMPLPANSVERKLSRRQNLAVDGNFCSRSPSSPSMDLSPGSIFQD